MCFSTLWIYDSWYFIKTQSKELPNDTDDEGDYIDTQQFASIDWMTDSCQILVCLINPDQYKQLHCVHIMWELILWMWEQVGVYFICSLEYLEGIVAHATISFTIEILSVSLHTQHGRKSTTSRTLTCLAAILKSEYIYTAIKDFV